MRWQVPEQQMSVHYKKGALAACRAAAVANYAQQWWAAPRRSGQADYVHDTGLFHGGRRREVRRV